MGKYRISPQALLDLEDIYDYIAVEKQAPLNASRFIEKLYRCFEFLAKNPGSGRLRETIRPGFMMWREGNYYIFYRTSQGGVDIVRIINANRDLSRLFS